MSGPTPRETGSVHNRESARAGPPRLLLLGGGHAHVQVLAAIAAQRWGDAQITLVSPFERQFYSGMLPGCVAGHYQPEDCVIPLRPWAAAAGVQFVQAAAVALDTDRRRVAVQPLAVADAPVWLNYDLLSIDTGSEMHRDTLPGAAEWALWLRPLEHFLPAWQAVQRRAAQGSTLRLVVIGSGAAGVELAFAVRQALPSACSVALVLGRHGVLAGFTPGLQRRVERRLQRSGIAVLPGVCEAVRPDHLLLSGGRQIGCDVPLIATGGQAPRWLQGSGLALTDAGRIATGPTLQSLSHPMVFAAGDVAARPDAPHAHSGVYAVRAGPPLARNLRRAVLAPTVPADADADAGSGDVPPASLEQHTPQASALYLLSCGDATAIASRGRWSAEGAWAWRWKDWIDRRFIARWQPPAGAASGRAPAR